MDEQLYDEFGNYIGPELEDNDIDVPDTFTDHHHPNDSDTDEWNNTDEHTHRTTAPHHNNNVAPVDDTRALTVQQDDTSTAVGFKQYYPEASEVYGADVDITIGVEDTQPITTPIIQPLKHTKFSVYEAEQPTTTFEYTYAAALLDTPTLCRNIAVIGNLHTGKTSLCDMLIEQTHPSLQPLFSDVRHEAKPVRYMDTRYDEQAREMTLKSMPVSLLLPTTAGKHYMCTVVDTPGHVSFSDEVTAALQLVDGCIVVVDAVEGMMMHTANLIQHAIQYNLQLTLCINKIDRLITDLKLPPEDCCYKLQYILDEVNSVIAECHSDSHQPLSPVDGSVVYASSLHGWSFTVPSFAQLYIDQHMPNNKQRSKQTVTATQLAAKLYGDNYYNSKTRKFTPQPSTSAQPRTFVQFILEPLYKLYAHCLGSEGKQLQDMLAGLGIRVAQTELKLDYRPLLKLVCQRFFVDVTGGLVASVVQHIPSPQDNADNKVNTLYGGSKASEVFTAMLQCDRASPVLMLNACKAVPRADASRLDNLARVYSGTLRVGDTVKVLGQSYTLNDREDCAVQTVTKIWLLQGRYRVEINRAVAGSIVLLEGIDEVVQKTATITGTASVSDAAELFKPLRFMTVSPMKLALEPVVPSELPKLLHGLRCVDKTYPLVQTRVEENGEHVLLGTSELYLDCVLHDLRRTYATMDIRVSDPIVQFVETCSEPSSMTAIAQTPNTHNRFSVVCEPLDADLISDLEAGRITMSDTSLLRSKYGWDELACRSIWSLGPDTDRPSSLLMSDVIYDTSAQRQLLLAVKDSIISGFQWAVREGPLIEEPVRGCKFRLVDAIVAPEAVHRVRGQLIPTARRALYTSFLLAQPKLMEPVYTCEVLCQSQHIAILTKLLQRRRGHIVSSLPKPGTPLHTAIAQLPLIDSYGFEVDLRLYTHGAAYCAYQFSHWSIVPGDPLDKTVVLAPLEPSPLSCLGREFLVKTRRRKGLADVNLSSYVDAAMLEELAQQNESLNTYMENNGR